MEEGDSYSVEYLLAGDREEPVCQVENGTLIVKEGDFGKRRKEIGGISGSGEKKENGGRMILM